MLASSLVPYAHAQNPECDIGAIVVTHPSYANVTPAPSATPSPTPTFRVTTAPPATEPVATTQAPLPTDPPTTTATTTTDTPTSAPSTAPVTAAPTSPAPATTQPATTAPAFLGVSTSDNSVADWDALAGKVAFAPNTSPGLNSSNLPAPIAPAADIVQGWAWANGSVHCWRLLHKGDTDTATCEYTLFIDADSSAATGYRASASTIGADYMLWQRTVYAYTGPATGDVWTWTPLSAALYGVQFVGANWEACAALGVGVRQTTALFFQSADVQTAATWTDDVWDWYPPVGQSFAFAACTALGAVPACVGTATPAPTTAQPATTAPPQVISTTDSSVADWDATPGVTAWPADPAGNGYNNSFSPAAISPSADILQGYVWADAARLCVRIRYAGVATLTAVSNVMFMDVDASPATGYLQSFNAIGAEVLWQDGALFSYTGTGTDWSWAALDASASAFQLVGNNYELCMVRSAIGVVDSAQEIRWLFEGIDNKGTVAWQDDAVNFYPYPGNYHSFKPCTSSGCGNAPAVLALAVTPDQPISPATVSFTVTSPLNLPVSVALQVSTDAGVTWRNMRLDASLAAVQATAAGTPVTVGWDATNDLGVRANSAVIRAIASDANGAGAAATKTVVVPHHDIVRAFVRRVDHHATHYGDLTEANMAMAQAHQLVVLHPSHIANVNRAIVKQLQDGPTADPADDTLVLCYISVGEDLRTVAVSNDQLLADPRFRCDGSGPRVDPRGPAASGQSLLGIDPLGAPSPGGTGWCSFYLDDNSVTYNNTADLGKPDRNLIFGGAFTNAGDPLWFSTLKGMLYDSPDAQFGIDELLTTTVGRGLGCDGLFLDTLDTAAPNSYTDDTSPNVSKFEWTAAGFRLFIERLRAAYPDVVILQNRGIFFFSPVLPQFQVTTRGLVDYVLFESFRLNSNAGQTYDPVYYPDNRYNYAPKLMAEANRPDGFRVLSLGYAEGPGIAYDTLLGTSTAGYDELLEDVRVSEMEVGFRHYLTSAGVDFLNVFTKTHSNTSLPPAFDVAPPVWSATYNPNAWPPQPPPPRVGIQRALSRTGYVEVQWDVALDFNRVHYALYYQQTPFVFTDAAPLAAATRVVMTPSQPADYTASATTFPYSFNVQGLTQDVPYWFLVRAFDESPNANEDANQVTLSAYAVSTDPSYWAYAAPTPIPTTGGPVWRSLNVTHTATNLQLRFQSWAPFNLDGSPLFAFPRINFFLDLDDNPATGYAVQGLGSDALVQATSVYRQSPTNFAVAYMGAAAASVTTAITDCTITVPITLLRTIVAGATRIRVAAQNDDIESWIPPAGSYLVDILP